jgi:hypothetical protein
MERKLEDLIDCTNREDLEGAVFGDKHATERLAVEIYQGLIQGDLQGFTKLYLINKLSEITGGRGTLPDSLREPLSPKRADEIRGEILSRHKELSDTSSRVAGGYKQHKRPGGTLPDERELARERELDELFEKMGRPESLLGESYLIAVSVGLFGGGETAIRKVAAVIALDKESAEESERVRKHVKLHWDMWRKL